MQHKEVIWIPATGTSKAKHVIGGQCHPVERPKVRKRGQAEVLDEHQV